MDDALRGLFERAGIPVRTIWVNQTGDAADVVLRRAEGRAPNTPCAAVRLTENGSTLRLAKDALEAMLDDGEGRMRLERVRDFEALVAEMLAFGIVLTRDGAA